MKTFCECNIEWQVRGALGKIRKGSQEPAKAGQVKPKLLEHVLPASCVASGYATALVAQRHPATVPHCCGQCGHSEPPFTFRPKPNAFNAFQLQAEEQHILILRSKWLSRD